MISFLYWYSVSDDHLISFSDISSCMRVLAFGIKSIEHVPLWILASLNPQRDVRVLRARSVQHDEIHHFAQGAVDLMEKKDGIGGISAGLSVHQLRFTLWFSITVCHGNFAEIVGNYHLQMGNYHWLGTHPATFFGRWSIMLRRSHFVMVLIHVKLVSSWLRGVSCINSDPIKMCCKTITTHWYSTFQ